jgi:hypothetical protein
MIATIELQDYTNAMRAYGKAAQLPSAVVSAVCKRPWVADVTTGKRVFVKGQTHYENANADGTKGVVVKFVLWPNRIYEVCEPNPPGPPDRYRCQVHGGKVVRI